MRPRLPMPGSTMPAAPRGANLPHRQLRLLALLTTLIVGLGLLGLPAATAGTPPGPLRATGKFAPAGGALLGAYVNLTGSWPGVDVALAQAASREQTLGRGLDINSHFYSWTQPFPGQLERVDASKGRMPMLSWSGTNLDSILNGSQDSVVHARAKAMKALGVPMLLRWNWEMNGDWNPGGGPKNNSVGTTNGPTKYVSAWKRLHDIFAAEGATNVAWVWAPNTTDVPAQPWNHWTQYYPGDSYVDWVGVSTYNWGTLKSTSTWHDLAATLTPVYTDYSRRKPFVISETASTEVGGSKASWIRELRSQLVQLFPGVAAMVWFDEDKETNWRIDSSTSALTAYKELAKDPYFNTRTAAVAAPRLPSMTDVTVSAAPGRPEGRLVPQGGALLGATVTPGSGQLYADVVAGREMTAGRTLDINGHDHGWTDTADFTREAWDIRSGRVPMITWRPDGVTLKTLARGDNDARVRLMAQAVKKLGSPVMLRFAPGMNGKATVAWSGVANSDSGTSNGTTRYVAAWKHVHDVFAAQGATNVVWVWAPDGLNAAGTPSWNTPTSYYPGDAYVDWVGINGINMGTATSGSSWLPTTALVKGVYASYATRKPIMVAQTGSVEQGGDKALWLAGAATALRTSFPSIAAWVYDDAGSQGFRLATTSSALRAWVTVAQQPYFRTGQ